MKTIALRTPRREALLDITAEVERAVGESGVQEGLCLVSCPHTTAAVTVNENADPDVAADVLAMLARLVPKSAGFRHAEGNSDAHVKSSLLGCSCALPVSQGRLVLGRWQAVFFCEFDGPRSRQVMVQVLGGAPRG